MRNIFFIIIVLFISSCVTEPINKKSKIFIGPDDQMTPIVVQGYVVGEEFEKESGSVKYPLRDVKISVSKVDGQDGITVTTLSTVRGFFSISPDYISSKDKTKYAYLVVFRKAGYEKVTKVLRLPSKDSSSLNVVLKRVQ